MSQILFTCPATAMKVQCELDQSSATSEVEYTQIACPACAFLHLVNRKTGKLLASKP
ncbi:hypothetical protein ABH995_006796 [Bradyrhizobium yuanmingense]|uniref:hypothetical protein n=1 Tax=Bradyrhizobium yuanmingense TaxID=108015 RepID=UPI0012FE3851|nr:hypothetical protein [Bradyrhizobium yuanmingense]